MRRMHVPDEKVVRVSAVNKPGKGDWGCSLSHLFTMEQFIDSHIDNCIVFEDDFVFTQDMETVNAEFREVFDNSINYDVVMLSANEVETKSTEHQYLKKVNDAQTTSGYMVTKYFAPILMHNYRDGAKLIGDSYQGGGNRIKYRDRFVSINTGSGCNRSRIGMCFHLNSGFNANHIRIFRAGL